VIGIAFLQNNRLFEIGAIILVVGAVVALLGGSGEVGYIQCIASSGAACTATASTQYITVFLANSEILSVGLSIVLVGAVIMIGGNITNYLAKLGDELKATMSPTRLCPKCGAQVAGTSKFCQSCGNKLGE
jgi:hypothetical protein